MWMKNFNLGFTWETTKHYLGTVLQNGKLRHLFLVIEKNLIVFIWDFPNIKLTI